MAMSANFCASLSRRMSASHGAKIFPNTCNRLPISQVPAVQPRSAPGYRPGAGPTGRNPAHRAGAQNSYNRGMTSRTTYDLADGIATITLDDGKVNALSPAMSGEISGQLDRAVADEALVVLLTGRATTFTAGFDLRVEPE